MYILLLLNTDGRIIKFYTNSKSLKRIKNIMKLIVENVFASFERIVVDDSEIKLLPNNKDKGFLNIFFEEDGIESYILKIMKDNLHEIDSFIQNDKKKKKTKVPSSSK